MCRTNITGLLDEVWVDYCSKQGQSRIKLLPLISNTNAGAVDTQF